MNGRSENFTENISELEYKAKVSIQSERERKKEKRISITCGAISRGLIYV